MRNLTKRAWRLRAFVIFAKDHEVGEGHKRTVDRVMRAYELKYKVSDERAKTIRAEVSKYIDELLADEQQLRLAWPERGVKASRVFLGIHGGPDD